MPTLRHALAGRRRMAEGRRGSLALRRRALPSPPPCRFIPALSQNPQYQAAAKDFASLTLQELQSVNVAQPGVAPQPVPGIQYVGIPQFEAFGQQVSAEITAAIDGQESVATALQKSQSIAQQAVITAGLKK